MDHQVFRERYGAWALVAGASEGLGAEFAKQLAAKGLNLILIAMHEGKLHETAQHIRSHYPVEIKTILQDLSHTDLWLRLQPQLEGLEIGLLVYNAAYAPIGKFLSLSEEDHQRVLQTNCLAPLTLAYQLGQRMQARKKGGLILVSSLSGFHGTAMVAHYAATKAYNSILAEGLWEEWKEHGLDVLVTCPGATRTPRYLRSAPRPTKGWKPPVAAPDEVVSETLEALGKKPLHIPGFWNRAAHFLMTRFLSRKKATQLISQNTRQMYE